MCVYVGAVHPLTCVSVCVCVRAFHRCPSTLAIVTLAYSYFSHPSEDFGSGELVAMPTREYITLMERGFGPGELVLCHPEWFVPAGQQHRDPSENRIALAARALASLPLSDRIEKIARLAHSWPKLLMKAMTKIDTDSLSNTVVQQMLRGLVSQRPPPSCRSSRKLSTTRHLSLRKGSSDTRTLRPSSGSTRTIRRTWPTPSRSCSRTSEV